MATDVIGQSTVSEPEDATTGDVASDELEPGDEQTTRRPRWRPDLWWTLAVAVVAVQGLTRWWMVRGLDNYHDDVNLTYIALDSPLDSSYLLGQYAAHFGPVNRLIMWLTVHGAPFDVGVSYAAVIAIMLLGDVGMLLALREVFGRGKLALALFTFFALTPVTVVLVGSWSLGMIVLPVIAGSAWTMYFHARAMRTGRAPSALAAVVALSLTLLSSPQSLFLVPFLVLYTIAYPRLVAGGRLRRTLRRTALMWVGYAGILVAYAALYRSAAPDRSTRPVTAGSLADAFAGTFTGNALPSLFGGSWTSETGALPSIGAVGGLATSLLIQALVAFVVFTVWWRPLAWRAWAIMAVLVAMLVWTMAFTVRFDVIGEQLLRQTRYVSVLLVPMTILLGLVVACRPVRPSADALLRRVPRAARTAAVVVLVLVFAESAWVTTYEQSAAMKTASTRTFWTNIRSALADHPTATIIDRQMPPDVVFAGFLPDVGTTQKALRYFVGEQTFSQPAEKPYVITDDGRLVRGSVLEFARSYPGGIQGCGYLVRQAPVSIPMNKDAFNFSWGVQLNYLAQRDTTVEVSGEGVTRTVPLLEGPHVVTLELPGKLSRVKVRGTEPGVTVCIDQVVVGGIVPNPSLGD